MSREGLDVSVVDGVGDGGEETSFSGGGEGNVCGRVERAEREEGVGKGDGQREEEREGKARRDGGKDSPCWPHFSNRFLARTTSSFARALHGRKRNAAETSQRSSTELDLRSSFLEKQHREGKTNDSPKSSLQPNLLHTVLCQCTRQTPVGDRVVGIDGSLVIS